MIEDLLPHGSLNSDTPLAIINAIYFEGYWKFIEFSDFFYDYPFRSSHGHHKKVTMCSSNLLVAFYQDENLQIVKLILESHDTLNVGVYFVLPRVAQGPILNDTLSGLDIEGPLNIVSQMEDEDLSYVTIPEFEIKYDVDLVNYLRLIGVDYIFDSAKSDFSKLLDTADSKLSVAKWHHKAAIRVTKEGVRAAAADASLLVNHSAQSDSEIVFFADHPFLFYVSIQRRGENRVSSKEEILFSGQFTGFDD
uniref:Serpin domain-containing protein n=1 Tax=Romanomermis culicivorax TaxID=13658 RepID=A0A915HGT7_ROMCU